MKFISKKESPIENIAFISLLVAINVVIVTITKFFPISFLVLMLILPCISTIESIFCKNRYYPLYLFATILLSFVINSDDIGLTLFYVTPSLITGFFIGLLIKNDFSIKYNLVITSLIQVILTYITVPIINALFEIDIIYSVASMFGLSNFQYINIIAPAFIYLTSIVQISISILLVFSISKRLKIEIIYDSKFDKFLPYVSILLIFLSIIFTFFNETNYLTLLLSFVAFSFYVFELMDVDYLNKTNILVHCSFVLIALISFLIFYNDVIRPFQITLLEIMVFLSSLYIIIVSNLRGKEVK